MGYFSKIKATVNNQPQDNIDGSGNGMIKMSTPFLEIGTGNLSLPLIETHATGKGVVYFGADNLFPQKLDQIYYVSPLHGSIVDFIARATVGGGIDISDDILTQREIVDFKVFTNKLKLRKSLHPLTRDLIIHARIYFKIRLNNNKIIQIERVPPSYVRNNEDRTLYYVSKDWLRQRQVDEIKPYTPDCITGTYLYCYERDTPGDMPYPLPQYISALNWCFLDGEMSLLHKSNIQNSIFASFMLTFPKKPSTLEEKETIRETIDNAKGANNAGRIFAFFSNGRDYMPELTPIPTNNNDQLFIQTDGRIDEKICQAHTIDPLLMGIRVSGKLGSGTDIEKAYNIFEKNTIMPLREEVEIIIEELLSIAGFRKLNFSIKNYQIVGDIIVDKTDKPE